MVYKPTNITGGGPSCTHWLIIIVPTEMTITKGKLHMSRSCYPVVLAHGFLGQGRPS